MSETQPGSSTTGTTDAQPDDEIGFELPAPARSSRITVAVIALALAGGAFAFGYMKHKSAASSIPQSDERVPRVEVIKPTALATDRALDLPGTVKPLEETKIYPRVTGYVRAWHVDIGDVVKQGQVLAEIDTPELDAQLVQARAQLAQSRAAVQQATAQRDYSKSNSSRFAKLSDDNLVSKGQVEQTQAQAQTDEANLAAAHSNVAAMEANVKRLAELQGFAKVSAPFAGKITTRSIDRGVLVSDARATPLFTLVATDPVRIFVDVPQTIAMGIVAGTPATVTVREYAGRKFAGTVARAAGALDPELHTMMTEIRVPNADGALLPGMFVQAQLTLPVPHKVFEIPATALYSDAQGLRVAVVDKGIVKLQPITIERDTGATLHVATGLTGDEQIMKIAVPSIPDGANVEVVASQAGSGSGAAK